jgi:2-polyprenyl-6-methoxyphenol hydroxylase-like FAD-dependent oxidoreductase
MEQRCSTYQVAIRARIELLDGMNVLAELGFTETLTSRATIARESVFVNEQGKLLGRLPYGNPQRYGQPAVSMSRALLFGLLAEELRREEIPIHYEKRVTNVMDSGTAVTISFNDGGSAQGDLLIGADGVRSAVRSYLLPTGPHPAYTGIIGIGGFTPLAALPAIPRADVEALTYTFGSHGFFGYGGADTGSMMWWSNLWRKHEFSHEELANLDQRAIQDELLQRYHGYHEPIASLVTHTASVLRMNVYDILSLPTWHRGRVTLMGDAAHAVSPNAGQGASMALEDAMCLAMLLRDCGGDYARAFAELERWRKNRVEKIVAEGRRRGGDKEEVSRFQSRMRNAMMRFFLGRASEKSDDWLFSYRLNWSEKLRVA